jgi:NAD(P)-dependent dehydrogenase (short-subunit alcohol dehydrogenase family)
MVITGGGSGLGRALAVEYGALGWRVAVLDRNESGARETAALVDAEGGDGLPLACDVTDEPAVARAAESVQDAWGGLDLLVNIAGVAGSGTVADTKLEVWRWILEVNVFGLVSTTRAFLPPMLAQRSGQVVNVASAAGFASAPGMAAYNASKAAVISISESLRSELAGTGIGVSVACPSCFRTNLLADFRGSEASRELAGQLMDRSPIDAREVARMIRRGAAAGQFMLVPHREARQVLLLKRYAPELFFSAVRKRAAGLLEAAGTPGGR